LREVDHPEHGWLGLVERISSPGMNLTAEIKTRRWRVIASTAPEPVAGACPAVNTKGLPTTQHDVETSGLKVQVSNPTLERGSPWKRLPQGLSFE
jgi:hypothetical protein